MWGWGLPPEEASVEKRAHLADQQLQAGVRAVDLAAHDVPAQFMLALGFAAKCESDRFRVEAERAVARNPYDADSLGYLGMWLAFAGFWDEGTALAEKAIKLTGPAADPQWWLVPAKRHWFRGEYQEAYDAFQHSYLEWFWLSHLDLAYTLPFLGRIDEAKAHVATLLKMHPTGTVTEADAIYGQLFCFQPAFRQKMVQALRQAGLPEGSTTSKAPAQAAHLSIVVLPFTNLSGDPAQDYFADGITENLTTELSRIRDSFVIARNTAFTYKGKSVDAKEIGTELGVRYVLEGSVQRDQNRVRINAQLVDAESGAHLWADRFEEDTADLFKLQDQVVARLASALGYQLIEAEAKKGSRSNNPDVIDLTMNGWTLIWRGLAQPMKERHEANDEARALFNHALQIDPNDADALAGSAYVYFGDFLYGWGEPGTDYEAKVLGQAERAISLAPDNVRGYFVKAGYLNNSRRPREGLAAAEAGLAINPNFVLLLAQRAIAENSLGRYEQAKTDIQLTMRQSPRDFYLGIFHLLMGDAELGLGRSDAAIDQYRQAIELGFRAYMVYANLAAVYADTGKEEEAEAALAEARRLNPKLTIKWMIEHTPSPSPVFDGLRKAGLPEE
jgi:TolB-like protein/Flp pilus assembly protein TadD